MYITIEGKINMSENILQNEKGSVLIVAVVMLVLITLMGLSVTRLSGVDVQIAKNEREYVQEFYTADSAWREVLTYFSSATQIGLTATPKETCVVSNIEYFGDYSG